MSTGIRKRFFEALGGASWPKPDAIFSFPAPFPRGNRRGSSIAEAGKHAAWKEAAQGFILASRHRKEQFFSVGYDVVVEVLKGKEYDSDNLAALLKWPLDYLVECRILADDAPSFAWPIRPPTQVEVAGSIAGGRLIHLALWKLEPEELERIQAPPAWFSGGGRAV